MRYLTNGKILLINTTTTNAHAVISGFSARYHNYRSNSWPGIWECRLIKSSSRDIQLQLIDRIYEPPRGIRTSESPIIHIALTRHGDDVVLTFRLRQQLHISITFLLYLAFALIMLFFSLVIFSTQYFLASAIPFFCSLILICIAIVWSIRNYNHNPMIILVFNEILRKNFDCSSIE